MNAGNFLVGVAIVVSLAVLLKGVGVFSIINNSIIIEGHRGEQVDVPATFTIACDVPENGGRILTEILSSGNNVLYANAPSQIFNITASPIWFTPVGCTNFSRTIKLTVPSDIPNGEYQLQLSTINKFASGTHLYTSFFNGQTTIFYPKVGRTDKVGGVQPVFETQQYTLSIKDKAPVILPQDVVLTSSLPGTMTLLAGGDIESTQFTLTNKGNVEPVCIQAAWEGSSGYNEAVIKELLSNENGQYCFSLKNNEQKNLTLEVRTTEFSTPEQKNLKLVVASQNNLVLGIIRVTIEPKPITPPVIHSECVSTQNPDNAMMCRQVIGDGPNQCSADADCKPPTDLQIPKELWLLILVIIIVGLFSTNR